MWVRWLRTCASSNELTPEIRPTYVALARATAERALASGRLRPTAAEPLLDILADRRSARDRDLDTATAPATTGERAPGGAGRRAHPRGAEGRPRGAGGGDVAVVMTMGALHEGHADAHPQGAGRRAGTSS